MYHRNLFSFRLLKMCIRDRGYTSWNDDFPADRLPEVYRIEQPEQAVGGYLLGGDKGVVSMEAEHYFASSAAPETAWTVIPHTVM